MAINSMLNESTDPKVKKYMNGHTVGSILTTKLPCRNSVIRNSIAKAIN